MRARRARPRLVGWEITRQCNLRCPHCYSSATVAPRPELSTKKCFELVDELAALKTEIIGFTGGEPLLREDLETIALRAKRKGIDSGITTNGLLLDARRAASLKRAGFSTVQVSVDGSTPEKNARMRATDTAAFERVLEAVRACRRLKLDVGFAMLLGAESLDDARPFLDLARREKLRWVRFCGFVPWGAGKREPVARRLSFRGRLDALRRFVEEARELESPEVMFDPGFGPTVAGNRFHPCVAGKKTLYLSSTGDVYPCTSLLDRRFVVGNVNERPLREIWNDPRMTEMASYPRERIRGRCASCEDLAGCHGACRGITYAYTDRLDASFPVCLKPRGQAGAAPVARSSPRRL
jgi:radical SAM protein with 4Fe4S-binding SPASM domain